LKINTEVQFAIVEEEQKTLRKKDNKQKSRTSSSNSFHSKEENEKQEKNSLRVGDYYHPDPHIHHRKERKAKEVRVDLPHFSWEG